MSEKAKLTVVISLANTNAVLDDQRTASSITVYKTVDGHYTPIQIFFDVQLDQPNKTIAAYSVLYQFADWLLDQSYPHPGIALEFVCTDANTNTSLMKFVKQFTLLAPRWAITKRMLDKDTDEGADRYQAYLTRMFSSGRGGSPFLVMEQAKVMELMLSLVRSSDHFGMWVVSLKSLYKDEEYAELRIIAKQEVILLIQQAGWGNKIKGKTFKKST